MSVSNSVSIELSNRLTILDSVHWMFFFRIKKQTFIKEPRGLQITHKKRSIPTSRGLTVKFSQSPSFFGTWIFTALKAGIFI